MYIACLVNTTCVYRGRAARRRGQPQRSVVFEISFIIYIYIYIYICTYIHTYSLTQSLTYLLTYLHIYIYMYMYYPSAMNRIDGYLTGLPKVFSNI